ncbi:uncharacterized protein LOC131936972 isoform X2 [Physella acuta]|uniref:uncharacterized protein LOC131936972 isoform X2 n=1 Tax=Physella acuta TaxID=109671 RepID=UPI0027DC6891|nr:uncharacterized protein LOC131936972 isoform X2 [Physella acuta]
MFNDRSNRNERNNVDHKYLNMRPPYEETLIRHTDGLKLLGKDCVEKGRISSNIDANGLEGNKPSTTRRQLVLQYENNAAWQKEGNKESVFTNRNPIAQVASCYPVFDRSLKDLGLTSANLDALPTGEVRRPYLMSNPTNTETKGGSPAIHRGNIYTWKSDTAPANLYNSPTSMTTPGKIGNLPYRNEEHYTSTPLKPNIPSLSARNNFPTNKIYNGICPKQARSPLVLDMTPAQAKSCSYDSCSTPSSPDTETTIHNLYNHSADNTPDSKNCTCNRSPKIILCKACGETLIGRVRQMCALHPKQIFLMDILCCCECKSQNLKEICDALHK